MTEEQRASDVDDLVARAEKNPEAMVLVLMGLKAHYDLELEREEERTGIYYLRPDDVEGHALNAELEVEDDGLDDEDEPDEGDFGDNEDD